MFEKNIKELEKKNPELAKKIKEYPYSKVKTIEVYESESKNLIISYKGVLLHSSEDPLREAKSVWHKAMKNEFKPTDIQLIYGIGLGYLFKRAYVNSKSRILLFEPFLDILRFVFENVDFSAELADGRVFIVDKQEDVTKFFEDKYLSGDKIEVLFLPSYFQIDQKGLIELSANLFQTIKDKNIDQNTALLMSKMTTSNLLSRIANFEKYSPVNNFENSCKDKTALIIAPGPSLQNDLDLIKKNRGKFIVIAMLPTLALLLEHNIKPDFVTVADPQCQMLKVEKYKNQLQDINMVIESRADFSLDSLTFNSFFVYFSVIDKISHAIFETIPNNKVQLLQPCASVALLSYRLAEILGCKEIIFSGLDLAMTDNKLYADNNVEISNQTDNKITLKSNAGEHIVIQTTTKSADGSEVKTREDYLIFIKEFEKIAQENPDIKMINTAVKGALIQGMTYQTMAKTVKNLKQTEIDIDTVIKNAQSSTLQEFKNEAIKLAKKTNDSFNEKKETIVKACSLATEMIEELSQEKPDMEKFQKIYAESKEIFSIARTFATQDLILSCCLQAEITEFITSYHKDSQITLEKLKSNIETEKKLFEKTLAGIDYTGKIIETII